MMPMLDAILVHWLARALPLVGCGPLTSSSLLTATSVLSSDNFCSIMQNYLPGQTGFSSGKKPVLKGEHDLVTHHA